MNDEQKEQQGKVTKEFEDNLKKLHGILGTGKATFKQLTSNQFSNSQMSEIIAELTQEREEKAAEDFKREMALILDETVEYNRHVKRLQREMTDKIVAKQKEMNDKFKALFNKVENVRQYRQEAAEALKDLAGGSGDSRDQQANQQQTT